VASALLTFVQGEQVRVSHRPVDYVRSVHRFTGVDCKVPSADRSKARCIGTTTSHAAIVGGHVVQGTTFVRVKPAAAQRRQPWAYYMSSERRGVVETVGKVDDAQLVDGFLYEGDRAGTLNLRAIADRCLDEVQSRTVLDRQPPLRAARTSLRFAIDPRKVADRTKVAVTFGVDGDGVRRVRLPALADTATMVGFCEDLALHDWLLTVALTAVERGRDAERGQFVEAVSPVLERLAHLWLPGARLHGSCAEVWDALESRTGMSRQWLAIMQRIRDQIALASVNPRPRRGGRRASPGRADEGVVDATNGLVGGQA
jgi:hypothetical protein